jgi:hypothetical protein
MKKFVYVFNTDDRDKLLNAGMTMLKDDVKNMVFVFSTDDNFSIQGLEFKLDKAGISEYMESDTLTF